MVVQAALNYFNSGGECIKLKLVAYCHLNVGVACNNSPFHCFLMGKVVHHDKLAIGSMEARWSVYELMKHCCMQQLCMQPVI